MVGHSWPGSESETCSTAPRANDDWVAGLLGSAPSANALEGAVAFEEVRAQLFATQAGRLSVDRYLLREQIGRGGCGLIYRAFDPKLQRDVAIKLISFEDASPGDSDMEGARSQLVREARALATVSHQNIVPIYGIGTYASLGDASLDQPRGSGVFIVMELIEGRTLAQWLDQRPHSIPKILGYFIDAANALAAAHDAGILHGDFKLANAMIGADGRLRVLDFGLARARADTGMRESSTPDGSVNRRRTPESEDKSISDVVMGTPAYMSPEQHRGEPLGAATDQYAWCVALYAALYGVRPFRGASLRALYAQKSSERIRVGHRRPRLPRALHALLVRGLRADPTQRHPSMRDIVDELRRIQRRLERGAWRPAVGGGTAALGLGVFSILGRPAQPPCSGAAGHLEGVWDGTRRENVKTAMLAVNRPYAPMAWETTARNLDAFADEWIDSYVETCEETTVRQEVTADIMDLRMACLHDAVTRLDAVTHVLADADADVVLHANEVLGELPSLDRCADVEGLRADVNPPPPSEAADIEAIRLLLADARSELVAGRFAAAEASVTAAKQRLRTVEYEPVRAEALLEAGLIHEARGQYGESSAVLREALRSATGCGHRQVLLEAATGLILVLGQRLGQTGEGLDYVPGALELAKDDVAATAVIHDNAAFVHRQAGDFEVAEREARKAIALRVEAFGAETVPVAKSRMNLATIFARQGRRAEAEAEFRSTLSLQEAILGPTHPAVASALNNLGAILQLQGKYADAENAFRRALEVELDTLGPEHPGIAQTRTNLGSALAHQGRHEEAAQEQRDALETTIRLLGDEHPSVAIIRHQLASTSSRLGDLQKAEEHYRLALTHFEETMGVDHPQLVTVRSNLAACLGQQGKLTESEQLYRRALSTAANALDGHHPEMARARTGLATVLEDQRRYPEALQFAELAWDTRQRAAVPDGERAETAFLLARLRLRVEPKDVTSAVSLAKDAQRCFERAQLQAQARDVQRWIERARRP